MKDAGGGSENKQGVSVPSKSPQGGDFHDAGRAQCFPQRAKLGAPPRTCLSARAAACNGFEDDGVGGSCSPARPNGVWHIAAAQRWLMSEWRDGITCELLFGTERGRRGEKERV